MRRSVRFSRYASLVLALMAFAPKMKAEPSEPFLKGKAAWQAGRYADALPFLLTARRVAEGRTADGDYMIGTSACRVRGLEAKGKSYLNWSLTNYSLDAPSRALVRKAIAQ